MARWRSHLAEAIWIWAATRAGFFLVGAASSLLFSAEGGSVFSGWGSWDGGYYLRIAASGYGSQPNDVAFFPLYPLCIRVADRLLPGGGLAAALVVSGVFSLIAFIVLHRLAEEKVGPGAGRIAMVAAAIYPWGGPFLVAAYAEAAFLALAVSAWYLLGKQRWIGAGFLGGLALVTKPVGAFLLIGLVVDGIRRPGKPGLRLAAGGLALVPFGAWMWWLDRAYGDPLAFLHAQSLGWSRHLAAPWSALALTVRTMLGTPHRAFALSLAAEIIAVAAGAAGTVWMARNRWWAEAAMVGSAVAFQAVNWYYESVPRMLGVMFPLALALAAVLRRRPRLAFGPAVVSAQISALTAAAFVRFIWVN